MIANNDSTKRMALLQLADQIKTFQKPAGARDIPEPVLRVKNGPSMNGDSKIGGLARIPKSFTNETLPEFRKKVIAFLKPKIQILNSWPLLFCRPNRVSGRLGLRILQYANLFREEAQRCFAVLTYKQF